MHEFDFPGNFYQSVPNTNSKQHALMMYWDKGNPYKLYDNIGYLPKTTFWYHSNGTKRNPWIMLYSHFPINDSSGHLHITVDLAVMLQAFWHTEEGNWDSKGSYIKSW